MEKSELLQQLNDSLDEYKKLQGFIEKAQAQAGKFSDAVIEKVCLDNQIKSMEVADRVVPVLPEIQAHVAELQEKIDEIESGRSTSGDALEELNLRKAIGEMTDKEYDSESKDLQQDVDGAGSQIDEIREELDAFQAALNRWQDLSGEEGEAAPDEAAESDGADVGEPPAESGTFVMADDEEGEAVLTGPEIPFGGLPDRDETFSMDDEDSVVPGEGEGPLLSEEIMKAQAEFGGAEDDDVVVEDDEADEPVADEPEVVAGDLEQADEPVVDEPVVDEPEVVAGDLEQEDEPVVVEVEGPEDDDMPSAELEIEEGEKSPAEMDSADGSGENGADEDGRRALLLYQEGTAEEQVYPFTGDELTIGRGRDNDIQIKNDSKVSRRHCRLFRKEGAFYMQDNKSSNGSLVNGELITERRLFGGEELIVGETFFRFRIMD
jgi:hypothetical protein